MTITNTTINLDQFETKEVAALKSYAPGTYLFKMMIRGNSLLSSAFLKNIPPGVTVTFNYFDTTTGGEDTERYDLPGHGTFTDADTGNTDRKIVARIHNKPQLEMIVAGGSAEVGVYVTVVTDFPIDLKGSILNGQTGNLALDGGLPISVYDPSDGKFYLLQGSAGSLATSSPLTTGTIEHAVIAAPNVEQSHVFPSGTRQFMLKSRSHGKILLSHSAGNSGLVGLTIPSGSVYESPQFAAQASKTIYFQSPVAGLVIELESWS